MVQKQVIFVGREQELKRICDALKDKKHVLILGEEGLGKTALVNEFIIRALQLNPKQKILLSRQSTSLKNTCIELVECLYRFHHLYKLPKEMKSLEFYQSGGISRTRFAKLRTVVLKNLFLNSSHSIKNLIVVLDHLGKIKSKFFSFLENLRDHAQLILIARTARKEEIGRFWVMLSDFARVELQPFSRMEANHLATHWLDGIEIDGEQLHDVIRIANGNPKILQDICREIRKQSFESKIINVRIANLDRQMRGFVKNKICCNNHKSDEVCN